VVALDQVFRDEWGRVLAALIGFLGDFDLAEEATQDAFAIAADRWPRDGAPASPRAWLVTTAFGIAIPVAASFLIQAMLVIGVAVPTPGAVGSFHEAYRIAVTTFFHAPNNAAVSAALVLHAVSFLTSIVPGVIVMAYDGMSVAGLGRLAGVAREGRPASPDEVRGEETAGASADEVPVLRPSGR